MPAQHAHVAARRRRARLLPVLVVVVGLAVVGVGATAAVEHFGQATSPTAAAAPTSTPAPAVDQGPLRVLSVTPADGATGVASDATVTVQFTHPLASGSPTPTLTPPVPGSWQALTPTTWTFVADAPFVPSTAETVTVPGGGSGITGAAGQHLAQATTDRFTVGGGSTLRLQQLLAQLGYLPVSFTPAGPLAAPQEAAQPQEGTFTWRFPEPASLMALWTPGASDVMTRGAVMAFELKQGLKWDGVAGPAVWSALLAAAANGAVTTAPYNYVYVSQNLPESTTVYSNGVQVYSTPANTGIPVSPTNPGTYPVYLRYTVMTMTGTNPNGTKYSDPGIPWDSFFNGGDALHGFIRSSYGFPQSLGCVEMPPANAAVVFPLTPIGTLVTVS